MRDENACICSNGGVARFYTCTKMCEVIASVPVLYAELVPDPTYVSLC